VNGSTRAGVAAAGVSLPVNLPQAVRAEVRRALHPPYETPTVVAANGVLMAACWTLLPSAAVDALFTFHGPLAFAMVLAVWMYSDVPATNLLGGDPARSIAALDDPAVLRRMCYAKNIVLWLLATPLCTLVAIGIGVHEDQWVATALTVLWIVVVPVGALGFAGWLGIWFPYHPLPLRDRWARRRRWRPMLARWAVLVLAPYGVVPLLTAVVTLPSLLLWYALTRQAPGSRLSDAQFGWGLLLAAVPAVVAWLVGHRYGSRLAHRRRERLTGYLADPDRG
jgi:hypothetical protein